MAADRKPIAILEGARRAALGYAQRTSALSVVDLMTRAQSDLKYRMRDIPATDRTFTAVQMRAALAQVEAVLELTKQGLRRAVLTAANIVGANSAQAAVDYLGAAEAQYAGVGGEGLGINTAQVMDRALRGTESSILQRIATDPNHPGNPGVMDRYGFGVIQHFESTLQTAIVTGAPWSDVRQSLVDGSPFLQAAPQYWAERIVRTELMSAHNVAGNLAATTINEQTGGMMIRILCATFDDRTASDSYAVHGQIRRMTEPFESWFGAYMTPPNRPNDREIVVPHHIEWPIPDNLKPKTDAEVAERWALEKRKGAPPPRPVMSTVPVETIGKPARAAEPAQAQSVPGTPTPGIPIAPPVPAPVQPVIPTSEAPIATRAGRRPRRERGPSESGGAPVGAGPSVEVDLRVAEARARLREAEAVMRQALAERDAANRAAAARTRESAQRARETERALVRAQAAAARAARAIPPTPQTNALSPRPKTTHKSEVARARAQVEATAARAAAATNRGLAEQAAANRAAWEAQQALTAALTSKLAAAQIHEAAAIHPKHYEAAKAAVDAVDPKSRPQGEPEIGHRVPAKLGLNVADGVEFRVGGTTSAADLNGASQVLFGRPFDARDVSGLLSLHELSGVRIQTVSVEARTWDQSAQIEIDAMITDAKTGRQGRCNRVYKRTSAGLVVKHEYFRMPESLADHGMGARMIEGQFATYRKLGVTKVETSAAWDGQYVWPSMGFKLTYPQDLPAYKAEFATWAQGSRRAVDEKGEALRTPALPHPIAGKDLAPLLAQATTIQELASLEFNGVAVGKEFLRQRGHSGSRLINLNLELNQPADAARLEAYFAERMKIRAAKKGALQAGATKEQAAVVAKHVVKEKKADPQPTPVVAAPAPARARARARAGTLNPKPDANGVLRLPSGLGIGDRVIQSVRQARGPNVDQVATIVGFTASRIRVRWELGPLRPGLDPNVYTYSVIESSLRRP